MSFCSQQMDEFNALIPSRAEHWFMNGGFSVFCFYCLKMQDLQKLFTQLSCLEVRWNREALERRCCPLGNASATFAEQGDINYIMCVLQQQSARLSKSTSDYMNLFTRTFYFHHVRGLIFMYFLLG